MKKMRDTTVMLCQITWLREHFGEECVVHGYFPAKQRGPKWVAMKPGSIFSVPESQRACVCHGADSKDNLGTEDKKRRAYVQPNGEN